MDPFWETAMFSVFLPTWTLGETTVFFAHSFAGRVRLTRKDCSTQQSNFRSRTCFRVYVLGLRFRLRFVRFGVKTLTIPEGPRTQRVVVVLVLATVVHILGNYARITTEHFQICPLSRLSHFLPPTSYPDRSFDRHSASPSLSENIGQFSGFYIFL